MTGKIILLSEFNQKRIAKSYGAREESRVCQTIPLSGFHENKIAEYFEVPEDDLIVRAAMKFVFQIKKEIYGEDPLKFPYSPSEIAQKTIDEIELGYNATRKYVDQFFMGEEFDRQGLMLAVICKDYTEDLGDRSPYIDEDAVERAKKIWIESIDLHSMSDEDIGNSRYRPETSLLAHVHIAEDVASYKDEIGEYLFEDIRNTILGEDIPRWMKLIDQDSDFGRDLKKQVEEFETAICDMLRELAPPVAAAEKPSLHLYRPEQPQP